MVFPSNPRLMTRILDTIGNLQDGKGSYVRDIIAHLRRSYLNAPRSLTMQVQRALSHAVTAGILRHQSGRYKVLFTLNPTPSKAEAKANNNPELSSSRSQNGTIKPDGKVGKDTKSARQRKEKTGSKQVVVARVRRDYSKERKEKGLQKEPSKRMQRKSKVTNEKNRITRNSGVDVSKLKKKKRSKKLNTSKSKGPLDRQNHSSCSEETTDSDFELKVPRKESRPSEKSRATSAPTRARSREPQQISKESSTSRKSIHEVRPVDSVESRPHLLLEPKQSTENILKQRASEAHVTINDNDTSLEDIEQNYGSNRRGSDSTL